MFVTAPPVEAALRVSVTGRWFVAAAPLLIRTEPVTCWVAAEVHMLGTDVPAAL
jgi:hypothetical protein